MVVLAPTSIRVGQIFLCLISINSPTRFACRGIIIWWYLNRYYSMIFNQCYYKISFFHHSSITFIGQSIWFFSLFLSYRLFLFYFSMYPSLYLLCILISEQMLYMLSDIIFFGVLTSFTNTTGKTEESKQK